MSHRLALAILLSTIAIAAVPANAPKPSGPPVTENDATSNVIVLGHHCDGTGAIDSIAFATDGPGPHLLTWNNEKICGRRS